MKNKIIILIFILGLLLRFLYLEKFSPPPNRDEIALAYNAYSLAMAGKDEHNQKWPLSFKSIGDYKMPGYIYLTIIPVKIFGLNTFSVRFWSALSGTIAILIIYFISKEINRHYNHKLLSKHFPHLSAFLLAINPWHIHYSRIGFEANVNLTLFLIGLYCLLIANKNSKAFIFASLCFVAMQFMYSSTFIFLPFFLVVFLILNMKLIKYLYKDKNFLISLALFIIGSIITIYSVYQVSSAKTSITLFSDPSTINNFNHIRHYWNQRNILIARTYYNWYFYLFRKIFINFIRNLTPGFLLFNKVQHPWHYIPNQGFFYLVDYIFLITGLVFVLKTFSVKSSKLLLSWLFIAPIASIITIDAPHATRSLYLIPVLIILISMGIVIISKITKLNLIILVYCFLFAYAFYQYTIIFPKIYSHSLFPGIDKPLNYLAENQVSDSIYFSNVSASPYLYYLFYQRVDPNLVHNHAIWTEPDSANIINIEKINNYNFLDNPGNINSGYLVKQITNSDTLHSSPVYESTNKYGQIQWQIIKF